FPNYKERQNEEPEDLKARLVYQSRKRGTLEIGLLLSTFASKFLPTMTDEQLKDYDQLINKPGNEWDLYYWIIGSKPTPDEFNTPVMTLLRTFAMNEQKELRITQPALEEK
ncbi:hypothetical protein HELRODRAFT_64663, partial [Helobdella robusta]|uniref:Succinate dehydrogenase assembly factor 2, mitochondrial n=1 Tax=Helobdella robusta TaxID=6412 RepID=T1FXX6_HELRO